MHKFKPDRLKTKYKNQWVTPVCVCVCVRFHVFIGGISAVQYLKWNWKSSWRLSPMLPFLIDNLCFHNIVLPSGETYLQRAFILHQDSTKNPPPPTPRQYKNTSWINMKLLSKLPKG